MTSSLISYLIQCYNEEKYIAQAVASAFDQTYENLEIILSDNRSTDSSHEIMLAAAAAYNGPHKVRVIKQPDHCNICEHANRLVNEVSGEYIIFASGDDLQDPTRTEKVVRVWQETGADMIGNNLAKITADGGKVIELHRNPNEQYHVDLEEILRRTPHTACTGAGQAWSPRLFDLHGPLPSWYHTSDVLVPFWGALEGGAAFISEPLTYFRITGENCGMGSQHMTATEDERHHLEEKMHADVSMHLLMIRRTLLGLKVQEPDRYDYDGLDALILENFADAAELWSEAREELLKLEMAARL